MLDFGLYFYLFSYVSTCLFAWDSSAVLIRITTCRCFVETVFVFLSWLAITLATIWCVCVCVYVRVCVCVYMCVCVCMCVYCHSHNTLHCWFIMSVCHCPKPVLWRKKEENLSFFFYISPGFEHQLWMWCCFLFLLLLFLHSSFFSFLFFFFSPVTLLVHPLEFLFSLCFLTNGAVKENV